MSYVSEFIILTYLIKFDSHTNKIYLISHSFVDTHFVRIGCVNSSFDRIISRSYIFFESMFSGISTQVKQVKSNFVRGDRFIAYSRGYSTVARLLHFHWQRAEREKGSGPEDRIALHKLDISNRSILLRRSFHRLFLPPLWTVIFRSSALRLSTITLKNVLAAGSRGVKDCFPFCRRKLRKRTKSDCWLKKEKKKKRNEEKERREHRNTVKRNIDLNSK